MTIPRIEKLRSDIWVTRNFEQHLETLQDFENNIAQQEGRDPCSVTPIPENERVVVEGEALLRGRYIPSINGPGTIQLDPSLLSSDEPYQTVETFFHENRHAYQAYAVQHPEIHDDPKQVEDWQKTNDGGYINSDLNFDYYRWQPVEADANQIARERTDELYSDHFKDNGNYPAYKEEKEQEISDDILRAELNLGENYIEESRQAVLAKYQSSLEQQDNLSQTEIPVEPSDSEEPKVDEDYDYYYGYST